MAPREKSIVAGVTKRLRERGAYVVKQHGSAYTRAGVPDLLCCYRGYFLGLEVKRPGDKGPTLLQAFEMQRIETAGGRSRVVRALGDAVSLLDEIDNGK